VACQYDESVWKSRVSPVPPATSPGEIEVIETESINPMSSVLPASKVPLDPSLMEFDDPTFGYERHCLPAKSHVQLADLEMTTGYLNFASAEHGESKLDPLLGGTYEEFPYGSQVRPPFENVLTIQQPQSSFPFEFPSISTQETSRSFLPRSLEKNGAQMSAYFILQILSSYPEKMLRVETFPPFIHPRCFSFRPDANNALRESLVNCMSLAQMFKVRTKETNKLLWRTIKMELERLCVEVIELYPSSP